MTEHYALVAALIAAEPAISGDTDGIAGALDRLCRAAARHLDASGVGIAVLTAAGDRGVTAASNRHTETLEDLQFTLGEGPCIDAVHRRRPVLVADLADRAMSRWPGYAPAVHDEGVRAVFTFPLQIGAARLGIMDVFRDTAGALTPAATITALTFAETAVATLIDDHQHAADHGDSDGLHDAFAPRAELFQAQGMVMIQIGGSITDAMSAIRAYAYAHDRRTLEVAADVVAGLLRFDLVQP